MSDDLREALKAHLDREYRDFPMEWKVMMGTIPKPVRGKVLGWNYRGSWYLTKRSAAFDYWKDLIYEVVGAAYRESMETGKIEQKPFPALPSFERTLSSL